MNFPGCVSYSDYLVSECSVNTQCVCVREMCVFSMCPAGFFVHSGFLSNV